MTIPSFKILKSNASQRLNASENANRVVLIYAGAVVGLSALSAIVTYVLQLQISQTGGLNNLGLRSMLSTVQSVLPMVLSMVFMCLQMGYLAAMLRVSREQYVSEQTLKLGFDRFWVLLRCNLLQGLLYAGVAIAAFWLGMQIFLFTPLSNAVQELLMPYATDPNALMEILMEETMMVQVATAMLPMFALMGLLYLPMAIFLSYSLRMASYVIIDQPGKGAAYALRESRKMMKGSKMRLFQLDLSFWWWYAIAAFSTMVCYGDSLLDMLGITLPWSGAVSYFLFYGAYLVIQFASWYFLRNRVEVVYAQVYNVLKPREKNDGVVLGNIFQM